MVFSVILTSGSLILLFPPTSHGKLLCIAKFENMKLMRGIRLLLTTLIYTLRKLAWKTHHPGHHLASFGLFLNSSLIWSAVFILRLDWWKVLGWMEEFLGWETQKVHFVSFANKKMKHWVIFLPTLLWHFESLWVSLVRKINITIATLWCPHVALIMNHNKHQKTLLLPGCLPLPFDISTMTVITRVIAAAIGKIYKIRAEKLPK